MSARIVHQRTGEILEKVFTDYVEAAIYRRDVLRPQLHPLAPCPYAIRTENPVPGSAEVSPRDEVEASY